MDFASEKDVRALDELFQEVGTYKKSADLRTLYEFIKKFPRFAPFNALLLYIQKPGSVYVAAREWKNQFNRTIKPGARPLVILMPFAPVRFVFELGDTIGDPVPDALLNPFETTGKINRKAFERLKTNLPAWGASYHEADQGTASSGSIQKLSRPTVTYLRNKSVNVHYGLVVNSNHSPEEKLATIAHELGHLFCGHLGTPNEKLWYDRSGQPANTQEFEAESVAWLVCERAGIHNPSAEYLSGYLGKNESIPEISLENVLKAAGAIEAMLYRSIEPRKELVIQKFRTASRTVSASSKISGPRYTP